MRFAHMADCHIGSWREPKLRDLSIKAFTRAINTCIEKNVDFVLISGDLFNTSLPAIDQLKATVKNLRELKEKNIPVYIVPGSHDFSPSGKTMLDVLEEATLLINVVKGEVTDNRLKLKFTIDPSTSTKITGMLGKKGMLERKYYENLDKKSLENEDGFKIFLFHTAISELKPKELEKMESSPISLLPKNFNYYAGGHVHVVDKRDFEDYKNVVYPGPLFPNNFAELEKLGGGGFYIYDNGNVEFEQIQIVNVFQLKIDCTNKNPTQIQEEIINEIENKEFNNTIVTIRLYGILESGKPSDIDFKEIFNLLYSKSTYFVMKNTYSLSTKEFEEIKTDASNIEDVEEKIIKEHLGQIKMDNLDIQKEEQLTNSLISSLDTEKEEGEAVRDFEKRVKENVIKILEIEDKL